MKEDFDSAIEQGKKSGDLNFFGGVVKQLAKKYGIAERTVYSRFNSIYGKTFREIVREHMFPTKERMEEVILSTTSSDEVKEILNIPTNEFLGIYDKYFGVSTYKAAKAAVLMSKPAKVRGKCFREDNVSILMSQYLGDGYYDRDRHSIRISHGIKQAGYLRWKVALIHEGYNKASTKINIRKHKQGHEYADYYSCKLGNVDFPTDRSKAVKLLTPIGWLLWYLDDGCYTQDLMISIQKEDVAIAAQNELKTYRVESRIQKCSGKNCYNLIMCGILNSIGFYKNFVEPFLDIIPECMLYKTKVKI